MGKEQIIAELISLRGGLSIVSKMTDEIRLQERLVKEQEGKMRFLKQCCEQIDEAIRNAARHKQIIDNWDKSLNQLEQQARTRAKSEVKVGFYGELWTDVGMGLIIGILVAGVFGACLMSFKILPIIGYVIGLFIYPILCFATFSSRRQKYINEYIRVETAKCKTVIEDERREMIREVLDYLQSWSIEYQEIVDFDDLLKLKLEYNDRLAIEKRNLEKVSQDVDKSIKLIAERSNSFVHAMRTTYVDVITESDWDNVDLIIHYFETGRADTLKEALQQVDRQKQTDQIVRAIKEASSSISRHIESAFSRMGQALALSFNRLDSSLKTISSQLEKNQRSSIDLNDRLLAKIDEHINITEMNAVLLEKANKTSSELLDDLRYNQRFWVK